MKPDHVLRLTFGPQSSADEVHAEIKAALGHIARQDPPPQSLVMSSKMMRAIEKAIRK